VVDRRREVGLADLIYPVRVKVAHLPAASFAGLEVPVLARAVFYPAWHGARVGFDGLHAVSTQVRCPSIVLLLHETAAARTADKDVCPERF